jgi:hypothetical protein
MTITWTITNLDRRTSDGFVTTAHWTAAAEDEGYTASVYSTVSWTEGAPTVPYADLTQEAVLAWVWASGVDKEATEAVLAAQIDAQKNPVAATGLPW